MTLRDRARIANGSCAVTLDAELCEALRHQTLLVLELGHEPFEDLRELYEQDDRLPRAPIGWRFENDVGPPYGGPTRDMRLLVA